MNKKLLALILGFLLLSGAVMVFLTLGNNLAIFDTQGDIAEKQRNLIIFATLLSLVVVLPVFALTFGIVWRYRDTNKNKTAYTPDWDHDRRLETIWWVVPLLLITVLSVVTWQSSHALDPYKPLVSDKQPLTVQVVALQWKWLFIYPEQNIATINELRMPTDRPIDLVITSDAPMNSLWIPQLAGQVYAMTGMSTQLHLNATKAGVYRGVSANISGEGFASMQFKAIATPQNDFDSWVSTTKTKPALTYAQYNKLVKPSTEPSLAFYGSVPPDLYDTIVMKYMPLYSDGQTHGMGH